jgi:flagellar basal body-associated protein FliL
MNCEECKLAHKRYQEESALAMAERTIRRLWITILVLIVLMAGMAVGFFWYESQFEEYTEYTEVEAEQKGDYNFVSGGDLNYGTESTSAEDN